MINLSLQKITEKERKIVMKKNIYGIDVGNYDTKSANTCVSSAYTTSKTQPIWESEYLFYNGSYYIPSFSRPAIVKDKTSVIANDRALILTLMSIGKETLSRLAKNNITEHDEIQSKINEIDEIYLGTGLPPRYMSKEKAEKEKEYYMSKMGNGIDFMYNDFEFHITLKDISVFPQGLLPTLFYATDKVTMYNNYYGIDIGGYTVDVVFVSNGTTDFEKTITLELGVLPLYENIIQKVLMEYDLSLDHLLIDNVLQGKPHILDDEVVATINSCTNDWVISIINELQQKKINLKTYPSCWSGGGSLLFKPYIEKSDLIAKQHEYIKDVRANAKSYQKMIQSTLG